MTGYRTDSANSRKPLKFNDLNMNDFINFLVQKSTWDYYEPFLKIKREALITLLGKVRQIRNDLAHFRREITSQSLDDLIYSAKWFENRFEKFNELKDREQVQTLLENYQQETVGLSETEIQKKNSRQSVYTALATWLKEQSENHISLTFEQVEAIIKRPLPASALEIRAWWANDRVGHTHSILWLDAGWRVEAVSLSERWVRFSRK